MHGDARSFQPSQDLQHGAIGQVRISLMAGKYVSVIESLYRRQRGDRGRRQGHPMAAFRLHTLGGDHPDIPIQVELGPLGFGRFIRASCC